MSPVSNELESFLEQTADALGSRGAITGFGVSRTLSVELEGRAVEICTNGPMLWLVADFEWPDFPTDGTFITWAPEQGPLRMELLEGPGSQCFTGDSEFDGIYLIHGRSSDGLSVLPASVIRLLLANEHLRPHLTGTGISQRTLRFQIRKHVRCEPSLSPGSGGHGTASLGTGLFQPEFAARWAGELSGFVNALAAAVVEE